MSIREQVRIFALSDTHLNPWPPVPADVDLVLFAGDFYDGAVLAGCGDHHDVNRFLYPDAIAQAERCDLPMFVVRGNHDYADHFSFFAGHVDVTGKSVVATPGLIVVGVGFAHREHHCLPTEPEMEQVCEASLASFRRIRPSHPDAVVILLTHYPGKSMVSPAEAATPGWAFDCVDRLADTLVPQIVICGHVHEAFGRAPSLKGVLLPGPAGGVFNM